MSKKFISVFTSLFLLVSLLSALPVQAGSVGEWVADFKSAADDDGAIGAGTRFGANGNNAYLSGTWTYDSAGDYVQTSGNAGTVHLNKPTTSDFTFGYKTQMGEYNTSDNTHPDYGVNTQISVQAKGDVCGSDKSAGSDGVEDDFYVQIPKVGNIVTYYPVGEYIKTSSIALGDSDANVSTYNFSNSEWIDVRYEFDFDEGEDEDNLLLTIYTYLNNKLAGTAEIAEAYTLTNNTCYVGSGATKVSGCKGDITAYGIARIYIVTGKETLIKDMYAYDGVSAGSASIVSVSDSMYALKEELINETFAGGEKQESVITAVNCSYTAANEYGTITQNSSSVNGASYIQLATGIDVGDTFIFRERVKFNDFNVKHNVARFFANTDSTKSWFTNMLTTAPGDGSSTSTLSLCYKFASGNWEYPAEASVDTETWYNVQIIGKIGTRLWYDVLVTDDEGKVLIDHKAANGDYASAANTTSLRFRTYLATEAMESGVTSSMFVDDIYLGALKSVQELTFDDVKIFQGQNVINANEPFSTDEAGAIKISALISNSSTSAVSGKLLVAQYSTGNELIALTSAKEFSVPASKASNPLYEIADAGKGSAWIEVTPEEGASCLKLFVIDSLGNLTPYAEALEISAQS